MKDEESATPDSGKSVLSRGNSIHSVGGPLSLAVSPGVSLFAVSLFLFVVSVILGIERQV